MEAVPRLPTFPAHRTLTDRRRRPHFVFWTGRDGSLQYPFRITPDAGGSAVILNTVQGHVCTVTVMRRAVAKSAGTTLLYRCPGCSSPRRYLYGLTLVGARLVYGLRWRCQACAGLRWGSQGHDLNHFHLYVLDGFAAEYGSTRYREPLPGHPWDPQAVSYPGFVMERFPGQLIEKAVTWTPDDRRRDAH